MSPLLLPPVVFMGLLITLWTYKSLILILLQNRIIYMPNLPPFSRSERIVDYERDCGGVKWKEEKIRGSDGVEVALAVSEACEVDAGETAEKGTGKTRRVCVVYFQGLVYLFIDLIMRCNESVVTAAPSHSVSLSSLLSSKPSNDLPPEPSIR